MSGVELISYNVARHFMPAPKRVVICMSDLRNGPGRYPMSCHVFLHSSLSSLSHVVCKKYPCSPVEFKGMSPLCDHSFRWLSMSSIAHRKESSKAITQ